MEKGQKFHSFYDKIVDYQKRKLLIIKNEDEMDDAGEYTREYKALAKAKNDILNKIKNVLEGALTFSEIISYGDFPKDQRDRWPGTPELSKDPNLEDYSLEEEKVEIKEELSNHSKEFVMQAFNEKILSRLFENIFFDEFFGDVDRNQKDKNEQFKNYKITIAKKMLKASMNELKKYMPIGWKDFLIPKLDEAIAICDMINKSSKEIEQEQINDEFRKSKGYVKS